ncbi:hypothetical protein [Pararhizobium sp. DWP3-4]|uniref:hypothetical protein n=1 Tax=Pararhizobium sp. DWP3-4 TaxID=2804565 RepID=UPI003CEEC961
MDKYYPARGVNIPCLNTLSGGDEFEIKLTTAELLGSRSDNGQPVFWRNRCGKGLIYVLCAPLEAELVAHPMEFSDQNPVWQIYRKLGDHLVRRPLAAIEEPRVAVTEHSLPDGSTIIALLNHHSDALNVEVKLNAPATILPLRGAFSSQSTTAFRTDIDAMDGVLFHVKTCID